MNSRTRLMAGAALIAMTLLALSACGTTSAATLSAPVVTGAQDSLAPVSAPQQIVHAQEVTQTIILTPAQIPVQQQNQIQQQVPIQQQGPSQQFGTPIPGRQVPGQTAVTPVARPTDQTSDGTQVAQQAVTPTLPYYPPGPVYPPAPAYPPIQVPPVQVPVTLDAPGVLGLHVVQPGDTLYCIGRAYQVDPIAIAQANSISGYAVIVPGHALLIPASRWTNIPPGPVCHPQFPVDWNQPSATSVTAVPLCGYAAFNYPAPQPGASTPLVSTSSFTNGYGETFAITVTGRQPNAIMAFTSNTPVCVGASRPQPAAAPAASAVPAPAAATAGLSQPPVPQLSVTDVLTDPNTFNLVVEFELTGAAAQRYGPGTPISFAIDPSIAPNALHYFYAKYRSSALAYLTANAGGITGTLYKNCQAIWPSQTLVAGQFNWMPLAASGSAYYALTVVGSPGTYGFNGYNVAGTWGNLEAVPGPMNRCP